MNLIPTQPGQHLPTLPHLRVMGGMAHALIVRLPRSAMTVNASVIEVAARGEVEKRGAGALVAEAEVVLILGITCTCLDFQAGLRTEC